MPRYSDLMGADAYPGEEPQAVENDGDNRFMHDDPEPAVPGQSEYNFFFGNGQLHVSPHHDHTELSGHAGIASDHSGPMAAGFVTVDGGRATWHVQGNVALTGFSRILRDYSKQVGWQWGGLTDGGGQPIDDSFAPKKSMVLRNHEIASDVPFALQGKTAFVGKDFNEEMCEALREAGYKVAEVPGGSNMNDLIINHQRADGEDAELYNNGDPLTHKQPEEIDPNGTPTGTFRCPECGEILPDWGQYLIHRKGEEPERDFDDDGHFPEMDMDAPLKPHYHEREPTVMPLASVREARRVDGFSDYADLWGYNSDQYKHYGAFSNGELLGYATVRERDDEAEVIMAYSARKRHGVGTALLNGLQRHYKVLVSHAISDAGDRLMTRVGFTRVGKLYKWAAGQEGKDMIDAPLPFIFDIDADKIFVGHPGTRTSDIPGKFTPGGIVEGEYAPGGKVTITTETNMPWSAAHMLQLWTYSVPHMQITSLELMDATGKTTKLAKTSGTDVGQYVKQVAATYPAAWMAYQALRAVGGTVYVVGGAVRDALLQKEPKDIDLVVTGVPEEGVLHALEALPGTVDLTGKNFGVYRFKVKGDEVEIALPRTEASTGDKRVDFDVKVDHKLPVEDDLLRRDFTINAMAVRLDDGKLVDPFGGAKDIENKQLRTTHPDSFKEDSTRLLRALVMHARYGFQPDERTRAEMAESAARITRESPMALQPIMDKLFSAKNPASGIRLAHDTGLLKYILPEVEQAWEYDQRNPHHNFKLGDHLLNVLEGVQQTSTDPDLRLAGLLHDIGKPASRAMKCMDCGNVWQETADDDFHCPRCGSPNTKGTFHGSDGFGADHAKVGGEMLETRLRERSYPISRIKRMRHLVEHHMFPAFSNEKGARKFLQRVGDDHADDLLTLRYADHRGKGLGESEVDARNEFNMQQGLVEAARSQQAPTSISALTVNGNDLLNLRQALRPQEKVKPGPWVGQIMRRLTDDVVEDPRLNDRNLLMERASEYVNAIPS